MSRSTALNYYSQTFSSPTTTYAAAFASNVFLWMSVAFLGYQVTCGAALILKGGPATAVIAAVIMRVAWLVNLSIIFYRTKISWEAASNNLQVLKGQTSFSQAVKQCGDPLTAMNVPVANTYMLAASNQVTRTYWLSLSMILLICLEVFLPCVLACLSRCIKNRKAPSAQYATPATVNNSE
jgi:hypothetical protein